MSSKEYFTILFAAVLATPGTGGLVLAANTYYVSPSGNDAADGLTPATAWATLDKVSNTPFDPGSNILFQAGGTWRGRLSATSSGTPESPITYSSYGTGPKPTFYGSDVLNKSSFSLVPGTSSTYVVKSSAPVGSVLGDGLFLNNAWLKNNRTANTTTNLNYVNTTPNSYYYDPATSNLYLNTGAPITQDSRQLTAVTRDDVVYSYNRNNLVFDNLVVRETAFYDTGYSFRVQNSSNVRITNSEAYDAGKHHFGVINSTGFVGDNLKAAYAMPDQGIGGASALVSYSDKSVSFPSDAQYGGTTSRWSNIEVGDLTDPTYPAYLSHGENIGKITISNFNSTHGAAVEVGDRATVSDVTIINGGLSVGDSSVDRVHLSGRDARVTLWGNARLSNVLIENMSRLSGASVAFQVYGTNNTLKFATVDLADDNSPLYLIGLNSEDPSVSALDLQGVIFNTNRRIPLAYTGSGTGAGLITGNHNVFDPQIVFANLIGGTLADWQSLSGSDLDSLLGSAGFIDPDTGNFRIRPGAIGSALVPATTLEPATLHDLAGTPRLGSVVAAGAYTVFTVVPEPSTTLPLLAIPLALLKRTRR